MKLLAKFNLLLIVVFGFGLALIAVNARNFLMDGAKRVVLNQAELMAASSRATRDYTEEEINPVLKTRRRTQIPSCHRPFPFTPRRSPSIVCARISPTTRTRKQR